MTEIAFILKKGSEMYKSYMEQKNEQEKFHKLAYDFFKKRDFGKGKRYHLSERLTLELDFEHMEKYKNQLMKDRGDNFSRFKLNSPMQKEWEKEVVNKCDSRKMYCNSIWYSQFIHFGSYSMWDYQGNVYGYLNSKDGEIKPCDDIKIIKLSEYYKIIEKMEEEQ